MVIRVVEVRDNNSWFSAAQKIIQALKDNGAKKGQVLWIDAHNNGPDEAAIFSAYWDDKFLSDEPLDIEFYEQNSNDSWDKIYQEAADYASTIHPKDLISMTGSCNVSDRGVFYVFYYKGAPVQPQSIRYCEVRDGDSWAQAADDIIFQLKNSGAKRGQVVSIDAHNNKNDGDAIFSAFWNESLKATGDLKLEFSNKNDSESWMEHYEWAAEMISADKGTLDVHCITGSCNIGDRAFTSIFRQQDEVLSVDFDLDAGKLSAAKPKVVSDITNKNNTDTPQKITFRYTRTTGQQTDNTSSFSHEVGTSLKIGAEFVTKIPFVAEGKISTELTQSYTHSWGTEKTFSNRFEDATGATAEIVAAPNTTVNCKFIISEAKMEVPYHITMKSGKINSGKWKGVSCWNIRSTFDSKSIV